MHEMNPPPEPVDETAEELVEEPVREAWFTSGLRLVNPAGRAFLAVFRDRLAELERALGKRQRARRREAVERWEVTTEALCAGLVREHLGDYPGGLAIALANPQKPQSERLPSRYDLPLPPPEMLRSAVALCEAGGLVLRTKGHPGVRSTLRTTAAFGGLIAAHGVTPGDLRQEPGEEALWLRAAPKPGENAGAKLEYCDTPATVALRGEMQELNARLAAADLTISAGGPKVDTSRRSLRRSFNHPDNPAAGYEDFQLGGRLWGGFWQGMSRYDRLCYLRIEGHPIAVVDWSSCWLRIAYAETGAEPPEGDLYEGLPGSREGAKRATSALLGGNTTPGRFPDLLREHFSSQVRWEDVKEAVFAAHPPVARLTGTGFALRACRLESDALMVAMSDLQSRGIVALPLHDAAAVGEPHAEVSKSIMEYAFRRVVGVAGLTAVETIASATGLPLPTRSL